MLLGNGGIWQRNPEFIYTFLKHLRLLRNPVFFSVECNQVEKW